MVYFVEDIHKIVGIKCGYFLFEVCMIKFNLKVKLVNIRRQIRMKFLENPTCVTEN